MPAVARWPPAALRRLFGAALSTLLTGAAVIGALCLMATLVAPLVGVRPLIFLSGSMSPTIPAGSLALAKATPAEELEVGDIVTVRNSGTYVTHRVVEVTHAPGTATLLLRGDGNEVDDATVHEVSSAPRTFLWVPGAGSVVAWFSHAPGVYVLAGWVALVLQQLRRHPRSPGAGGGRRGAGLPGPFVLLRRLLGYRRWSRRGRVVTAVTLTGSMALASVLVAAPALANWADSVTVTGNAMSTDTLARPTTLAVSQSCVPDPTPVRRSGAGGTSFTSGTTSGTLTIARPTSAVSGDVLIAGIGWVGNHLSTSPTAPAGWTLIRRDGDNALGQFSYYRVAGASEPTSYTWTGLAENSAGGIAAYSGVDTANPINAHAGQMDTVKDQAIAPSITTTRGNVVLVSVFSLLGNSTTTAPPSMTAIFSGVSTGTGSSATQVSNLAAQESWPTPGATGTRTATGTGARSAAHLLALQPPAYPYATTTWTPSVSTFATGQDFRRSSSGVLQRQATLSATTSTETGGPLVPGTSDTIAVYATYANWVSTTTTTDFTARSCWPA